MLGNKIIEKRNSKYNGEIVVKKTLGLGTYLQVEGITQSGRIIESIWKPVLKKIKRSKKYNKNNINSILILGLGGGTVARLIRKYFPKSKVTGVEIDSTMVELGRKYLNLDKYSVNIKIADANKFSLKGYDLILIDTYFGSKFVNLVKKDISKGSIVAINQLKPSENFEKDLKSSFSTVEVIKPLVNTVFVCEV